MVYEIVWTSKALTSYINNIKYLQDKWTEKEVSNFIYEVEKKLNTLAGQPLIGIIRSKRYTSIRQTVINKRVLLIYRVKTSAKKIELLRFWNTYQDPRKLSV